MRRLALAAAVLAVGCGGEAATQTETAQGKGVRLQKVGDFSAPVYVTAPPADKQRVFVVEQAGTIQVLNGSKKSNFLDITNLVESGGEQGLLSMAFAPDYAASGLFYVYYTDKNGDEQIVEYKRSSDDAADPGSARQVLMTPDDEGNHNGGQLQFGPDKLLYIGTGDGGGGGDQHGALGNGQNLGTLLGKLLRIDPKASGGKPYTVPSDNPFRGKAGAKPEIYAYGLRNPWRFSFDRKTGDITIGDVGQGAWEEINFMRKGKARGANFGWRVFEGNERYADGEKAPGHVKPAIAESHSAGNCSITGGYVIRDPALKAWNGRYVFGDYCRGVIQTAKLPGGKATDRKLKVEALSSFGEDARGRVYVTSLDGPVYRLAQ